jgi:hypothetical protein
MRHTAVVLGRNKEKPSMQQVITIGLDIAKHVFQVHGVDDAGAVIVRRKLRRSELTNFFAGFMTRPLRGEP